MWGGKEMRKGKTFRRIAAGFLAAGLVISQAPVTFAAEVSKQESVYVTANADGSVKTGSRNMRNLPAHPGSMVNISHGPGFEKSQKNPSFRRI